MDRVHSPGSWARFTASLNWSHPNHDLRPRFNINEGASAIQSWPLILQQSAGIRLGKVAAALQG
jgi:hypothetical protein